MLSSREILIYLSVIFKGDWKRIYHYLNQEYELPSDKEMLKVINNINSKAVTMLDPEYPEALKYATMPPFVLFYHGDISLLNDFDNTLSIIGTREPTEYGIEVTKKIVEDLAGRYIIVSGMALGIDSIAQETTMNLGGKTVAVLGCGINNCYVTSLIDLYERIKEKHLIISEYPESVTAYPSHFPFRNRIIAALGKCLLVTEARVKSGTSTTVGFAIMGHANVLAIPARCTDDSLCNVLIREGAGLVRNAFDVIDEMDGMKYSTIFPPR